MWLSPGLVSLETGLSGLTGTGAGPLWPWGSAACPRWDESWHQGCWSCCHPTGEEWAPCRAVGVLCAPGEDLEWSRRGALEPAQTGRPEASCEALRGVHAETFTERGEGAVWDLLKLLQNLLGTGQEIFGLGHPVTYPVQGWVCLCPPCAGEALWLSLGVCQQAGRAQG